MHGFDAKKLTQNLDRLLSGWVESGEQPCVQALVIRRGETAYDKAFGWLNREAQKPLPQDAIFRIYSMSKVFTSVAMMMLHEEGRFKMHDPLSKFIPAFRQSKVCQTDAAGHIQLVAPRRELIIRDLFTMASGIPYPGETTQSERAMTAIFERFEADARQGNVWPTQRVIEEAAKIPLAFHPGEHWLYGFSIDILGGLVEVLSGQTLDAFLKARVFDPLGLTDTGFYVPEEKLGRFVTMYAVDAQDTLTPIPREKDEPNYYAPQPFSSGGGGLVSTARDMGRFAQMLLNFGAFGGARLLSRKSVELMRINHLSAQQLIDYNWDTQRGYGYGLGVRVMMHPVIAGYGSVGEFAWDGMAGTWFAADPSEDLVMVFLVQTTPGRHYRYVPYFAQTVYGALDD